MSRPTFARYTNPSAPRIPRVLFLSRNPYRRTWRPRPNFMIFTAQLDRLIGWFLIAVAIAGFWYYAFRFIEWASRGFSIVGA